MSVGFLLLSGFYAVCFCLAALVLNLLIHALTSAVYWLYKRVIQACQKLLIQVCQKLQHQVAHSITVEESDNGGYQVVE